MKSGQNLQRHYSYLWIPPARSGYNVTMHKKTPLATISVFILCMLFSGIAEGGQRYFSADRASLPDLDITQLENRIHELVNKERAKRGLSVLQRDKKLNKVARKYSQDMVKRNFFSHNDPDGRSFYDRYEVYWPCSHS